MESSRKLVRVVTKVCHIPCRCGEVWKKRMKHDPHGCTYEDLTELREVFFAWQKELLGDYE